MRDLGHVQSPDALAALAALASATASDLGSMPNPLHLSLARAVIRGDFVVVFTFGPIGPIGPRR